MPGSFIAAIVFAVITGMCLLAYLPLRKLSARDGDWTGVHYVPAVLGTACAVLTVCLTLASSWNPVPTQDIGIVTSYGQPVGHLNPGFNLTPPWEQVTDMDEAYQVTDATFTVRIAGGQTAQATVQVRWQVNPAASDAVFKNYKNSTSGVENGLLLPELNAATNTALDGYDPLTPIATGAAAGSAGNPTTTQLAAEIVTALTPRLDKSVLVRTLVLKPLVYDETVQARINSVLTQTAKTDVAKQAIVTAQAQATANRIAEASLAHTGVLTLVQQCMNAISDGQFNPPAGFSCWPGQGSGIVVPAAG